MRILLAIFLVLAMSSMAMAYECPDDSLRAIYHEDSENYAYTYQCTTDDDTLLTNYYIHSSHVATDSKSLISEIVKMDCISITDKLIICGKE